MVQPIPTHSLFGAAHLLIIQHWLFYFRKQHMMIHWRLAMFTELLSRSIQQRHLWQCWPVFCKQSKSIALPDQKVQTFTGVLYRRKFFMTTTWCSSILLAYRVQRPAKRHANPCAKRTVPVNWTCAQAHKVLLYEISAGNHHVIIAEHLTSFECGIISLRP